MARDRPEQADRAGDPRQVVGQHVLAEQRLRDARAEQVGDLLDLVGGAARALADEDRDLLALVEDLGGVLDVASPAAATRGRV